jgi:hypothetical protein
MIAQPNGLFLKDSLKLRFLKNFEREIMKKNTILNLLIPLWGFVVFAAWLFHMWINKLSVR